MSWSANRNCVFNAYRYSLGMGELYGISYADLKLYITDRNFYKVNSGKMFGKDLVPEPSTTASRFGDLTSDGQNFTKITPTNLILSDVYVDTFNSDTGFTSETTYEGLVDLPASAKIFSTDNDGSWITSDLDWVPEQPDTSTLEYFKNEYNLQPNFSKTEYQSFGLKMHKLDENVTRIFAGDFELNQKSNNKEAMDLGANGVLLTYYNPSKGYYGDSELPVSYYEFGKVLYSNYNQLDLAWHEDGIICAE